MGKLLVAKPELADPNFAATVVLIVHYEDEKGTIGLILNRRTDVPLSKVLPQIKGAKEDPVYEGGPVETATAQALLRVARKARRSHARIRRYLCFGKQGCDRKARHFGSEAHRISTVCRLRRMVSRTNRKRD